MKRELDLTQIMDNYKFHLQQVIFEQKINGPIIVDNKHEFNQRPANEEKELELVFQNKLGEAIEAETLKIREESKTNIEYIEL